MAEQAKVTINGQEFAVDKGSRLIDVCREKGFGIPSFCYYKDLALQASCRMCLVRIDKMPKLQTSCTISVTDGMVVTTNSEEVEKAQRAMGEFLLANHPLDCPVCDRGGECELQEVIFDWGDVEERFSERKNVQPEKYLSPFVANDPQRCILCKRCTRVCDEWMGEDAIEAGNRGVNTVIGTYGGWLNCSQCGNCIEVCPTGTLLDGVYRHETRPWELENTISTDCYSSDGMQIAIGSRMGQVHRIVARDRYVNGLNGEFLDVKARFAHGFIDHPDRIKTPLIRYTKGGKLIPATWDQAVQFAGEKLAAAGKKLGVIASPRLTNESIFTLRNLAEAVGGSYAISEGADVSPVFRNLSVPLATHNDIRYAATIILIFGVGLVFYFIPNAKTRFRDVWVGAALTGVLWRLAFDGFSWYIAENSRLAVIQGSIAAVVVFLLWIYVSSVILMYGVEFTAAYARLRRHRPEQMPAAPTPRM